MVKKREAIDAQYQWDLTTIFATDAVFEAELADVLTALEDARSLAGTLTNSAETLLAVTETELALMQEVEKLYVYASMKNDQDTTVSLYQEYQAKVTAL